MEIRINDRIRNRRITYFNNFRVQFRYDSVASGFTFGFYFDPENQEHIDLACIGHYHLATVEHNGQLLLTGYVLSEGFSDSNRKELVTLGGYSLPGVLEDCEIPTSVYPLQSDGLTLREIAQKLIAPFGLKMMVDSSVSSRMNQVYSTSTARPTQKVKSYLTELAAQKNIVLTHDVQGRLVFTQANTRQTPILNFDGGVPFLSMKLIFNGQPMHSHITVMKQADLDGGNAGQSTVRNPYVPFVFRPTVVVQNSGDDNNTDQAAKNILAAELKNLKLTIETDRWEIDGKVIMPNNLITVINPKIYLFKKTTWFIESVTLTGDQSSYRATLECVLPAVYDGNTPTYIFSGINLH